MRNDHFTYEIATGNGTFDLALNFAYMRGGKKTTTGERLIDIYVDDELVFNNLDVTTELGKRVAFDLIGRLEVTDGALTLAIINQSGGENAVRQDGLSVWDASGGLDDFLMARSIANVCALA